MILEPTESGVSYGTCWAAVALLGWTQDSEVESQFDSGTAWAVDLDSLVPCWTVHEKAIGSAAPD